MSNVAFDIEVLKQVAAASPFAGNPMAAQLGAIGPDLFEFLPISSQLSDALDSVFQAGYAAGPGSNGIYAFDFTSLTSNTSLAQELLQKPTMAAYAMLFRELVVDNWPVLQQSLDTLNALQVAAANRDAQAVKDQMSALQQASSNAGKLQQLGSLTNAVVSLILALIAIPPNIQSTNPNTKPLLPQTNRLFEFLRWHHTDRFTSALLATATSDDEKAYAYGHLCHVAASVTGRPFINNIGGGPYRTHWWRNRLVSNYVDAWTFGRYETPATMTGDEPSPAYAAWANLCTANLQHGFNLANLDLPHDAIPAAVAAVASGDLGTLPSQFPSALAAYIQAAIDQAYPSNTRPPGFSTDAIGQAFIGLSAVVWFMTSGLGPQAWHLSDLGTAPSSCTSEPSWATSHGSPPSPTSDPGIGDFLAGLVFILAGFITFIFGSFSDGWAHIKNGIGHFETQIDWDTLACNIYWMRYNLYTAGDTVAKVLVDSGLAYPLPEKLGTVFDQITYPASDSSPNPLPLTKSNFGSKTEGSGTPYPHQMDATRTKPDENFLSYPPTPTETPSTLDFPIEPVYPQAIVNGVGLVNGGLRNGGNVFPSANLFFGDAVSNALDLIGSGAAGLPSFNLDADRGYGFLTWLGHAGTLPGNGDVSNPRQEN